VTQRVSTTRRTLLRLRLALLGLTAAVLAMSAWSFAATQTVLSTVRDQTAPAVLDVASAHAALVQAHAAAVSSFVDGGAALVGPGEQYETDLAVAEQDLARAAGDNAAGSPGGTELQLIAGLLTTYSGWISQADTHLRDAPTGPLHLTDLWYAARSLVGDDQTLAHLETLADEQRQELDQQLTADWLNPVTVLAWLVPSLLLLALLLHTQRFLRRRFRRQYNPWLIGATAVLVLLVGATSTELLMAGRAHTASAALTAYVSASDQQSAAVFAGAEQHLVQLVRTTCGPPGKPDGCGDTMPTTPPPVLLTAPRPTASSAADATAGFASATEFGWLLVVIPVLAGIVAALVLAGLQPRVDEYRNRS
jgi:hypothetical protein